MLRLRSVTKTPPGGGGFRFQDRATGWRTHNCSFKGVYGAWYQELVRRGQRKSQEACARDVEVYMCEELMKHEGWQDWVLVETTPVYENFVAPMPPAEPTAHRISVIMPIYQPSERAYKAILAVKDQVDEVITVTDGVPTKYIGFEPEEDPKIKYIYQNRETGFGEKCNIGAKSATGQYLWFLNDDCYPNPGCADQLVNVLTASDKIGVVGHLLWYPDTRIQHAGTKRDPAQVGFPHIIEDCIKEPTEMEAVTAASMMVKREAFDSVNGFCEDYFMYLEDSDLCLRLREKGWKVYYTPNATGIHEEHASSSQRPGISEIVQQSVNTFQSKWKTYFDQPPPKFESFDSITKTLNVDVVYVHLVGHPNHNDMATNFVNSALRFPPGQRVRWVIALNSNTGEHLSAAMKATFDRLGNVKYFRHDNSGWDIGAFQAYSKVSTAEFCLFFGSTAYFRRKDWIHPVMSAWRKHGEGSIYGTCGNLGDSRVNVSPHLRSTGFWCSPAILNRYPVTVTTPAQRYPFEHGATCLTVWAWSQGLNVLVVDATGIWGYPRWNDGKNGFHRGDQSDLLFGDRITSPPYYQYA